MAERWLIFETSTHRGQIGLAEEDRLIAERTFDDSRRHARDLVPGVRDLMAERGWQPRDLTGVMVSQGPGSYTGLRVGLMSAKTLAYVLGCELIGVPTFEALARQVPADLEAVDVIADAQQDKIYVQRFANGAEVEPLRIVALAEFLKDRDPAVWWAGPGLAGFAPRLAGMRLTPEACWMPTAASVLIAGRQRWSRGIRDDAMALEPIYHRPSSAEEKFSRDAAAERESLPSRG